ncbi:23S rRNA (adenine(2503)-C(2))-methyltransferase RlmN [Paramagnetospirillum kuznetsovii]|uniref:Dual-specificity RNA methyltransferase RlmN n=1 Tax=Paramagnetospirillum kuznetsovii TaxID=2053833 RepID=A0A364NU60_9PROT|nr:23S rRNA (adenine(2503)-C(2))-methyltransferase RlmN [Paramagnetospirillum kuznetsovii]RAU20606.1 23S rRNA (adenine(2503)-C(2))-methyltransferase RlmN [Paramagnetospirillum kuznetsovii]
MDTKTNLIGLSRAQLAAEMEAIGEKPFRAKQLWHWMYNRGETDFAAMSSISKVMQAKLAEHFQVRRPKTEREMLSADGTRKWLLKFDDGNEAETVFIPDLDEDRGSVCISTQVGCTLTCKFCHTGTQLLVRNLTAAEIIGQFMAGRDAYGEWPTPDDSKRMLSNIVVMGMGEPLYNFENVATALEILMDGEGIGISKRRITLSTSGVVPMMKECGARLGVNLAISLHAVTDEIRDRIMPINKKYPLKDLIQACRDYPGASNARRITFEYIMLKGVNDSAADARALLKLIKGLPAKFNLIPFNPWPGSEFETSDMKTVKAFSDILQDNGYSAPIRMPRGRDILAACGQLRSESLREKAGRAKARAAAGIEDEHHGG